VALRKLRKREVRKLIAEKAEMKVKAKGVLSVSLHEIRW
jgi:hypothetical protein